jgi:chemotaxis protein CheD
MLALDRKPMQLFDKLTGSKVVKVHPGDHYVTDKPDEMLVTVLGSCVSACIRDPFIGVGGMNHFMLPESETEQWGSMNASLRFGNYAMERLINDILKAGGIKKRLEIKVFGGGKILKDSLGVGYRNAAFVQRYLAEEGLRIASSSLGGDHGRRIHYYPATGKVMQKFVEMNGLGDVAASEKQMLVTMKQKPVEDDIELFG